MLQLLRKQSCDPVWLKSLPQLEESLLQKLSEDTGQHAPWHSSGN